VEEKKTMDSIVDRALSEIRQKKEKEMQRIKRLEKITPIAFVVITVLKR
jgi:hypothetical protein